MVYAEKKTTRVQFELPPEAYARLQRLKDKTDATSYAEVAKKALILYAALHGKMEDGAKIYARDEHGNLTELVILV